jgi:hypothetical protein
VKNKLKKQEERRRRKQIEEDEKRMDDDEIKRLAILEDEARREEEEQLIALRNKELRGKIEKENTNNKNDVNENIVDENNFLSELKMSAELDRYKRNPKWDKRLDKDIEDSLKLKRKRGAKPPSDFHTNRDAGLN